MTMEQVIMKWASALLSSKQNYEFYANDPVMAEKALSQLQETQEAYAYDFVMAIDYDGSEVEY